MKKIFYFLAISLLLIGCEGNNPELKNQPLTKSGKINKYWTPAGHTYSHNNSDGYNVYRFFEDNGECVCESYFTPNNDLSVSVNQPSLRGISGEYPNFTITDVRSGNDYTCTFTDTLTCTIDGLTYKLYR